MKRFTITTSTTHFGSTVYEVVDSGIAIVSTPIEIKTIGPTKILTSLDVYAHLRRRGVGKSLVAAVCEDADREGCSLMLAVASGFGDLDVPGHLNDAGLMDFYRTFGFRCESEVEGVAEYRKTMVRRPSAS